MKLVDEYISKSFGISDIPNIFHIPRCSFYRINKSCEGPLLIRVRQNSLFTLRKEGDEISIVDNGIVINEIEKILSRGFVCCGYKKTVKQLNRLGYEITGRSAGGLWQRIIS